MTEKIKKYGVYALMFVLGFASAFFFDSFKKDKKEQEYQVSVEENVKEIVKEANIKEQKAKLKEYNEKIIAKTATSSSEYSLDYLKVSEQKAGKTVNVAYAKADFPFWIVIHAEKDGKIWNALGARMKKAGEYTGVEVPLLVEMQGGGKRYWAILYKDNGDGQFDLNTDFPATDENGNYIAVPFKVY